MSLPNAFVTLLTTPSYLPGALVLLHSLLELHPAPRDFKTVCIVTPESVDAKVIGELRNAGYDLVIGVEGISSGVTGEDGLNLMGRPDLNMALTKLHLFRLHTLFSTLIYLDADVLPLRPLAHLFSTTNPHVLSACPDTGWPDCFNSGVMVIRPRESDFEGLRALLKNGAGDESPSESGGGFSGNGSFDGADQGLLNEWFSEEGGGGQWNRLPFTYNVTPSAAYTYKPAYHRYGHKINVVHFIGPNKPWANLAGRPPGVSLVKKGKDSYDYPALIDRWYDVYDRNVRPTAAHSPDLKVRFAVPEYVAVWNLASGVPEQPADRMDLDQLRAAAGAGLNSLISGQYISLPLDGRVDLIMPKPKSLQERIAERNATPPKSPTTVDSPLHIHAPLPQTLQQQTQQPATWDGSRYSPPKQGEPEMKIPLDTFYESAWDAPATSHSSYFAQNNKSGEPEYPTLPSSVTGDSWYGAFTNTKPDKKNIQAVFPWEQDGHSYRRPDRVFPRGSTPPPRQDQTGLTVPEPHFVVQQPTPPIPSPETSSPPSQPKSMADAMASYTNAWDKMPEIQDYVTRITGRKSKGPSHISIRSKDLNGMGLASVPGTPAFEVEGTGRRREISMDRHSEASGDGDDEAGEESDDESSETSRKAKYPGNSNYRDRRVQTDKPSSSDATVQAGPNPGLSPAVATFEIPSRERQSASAPVRVSNTRQQSSSSDTTVRGNPFTPPSVTSPDSASGVTINFMGQSASFASRNSQSSGNGNGLGKMHDRRTSYSSDQREQVAPAQARPASRIFDPSTDVDVRKRDTQNVLSRFMKVGSFAQSNPDAKQ